MWLWQCVVCNPHLLKFPNWNISLKWQRWNNVSPKNKQWKLIEREVIVLSIFIIKSEILKCLLTNVKSVLPNCFYKHVYLKKIKYSLLKIVFEWITIILMNIFFLSEIRIKKKGLIISSRKAGPGIELFNCKPIVFCHWKNYLIITLPMPSTIYLRLLFHNIMFFIANGQINTSYN